MDILSLITDTDAEPRPRRVLLYGSHGIGKSTFAACAPNPIFVRTEDGARDIKGAKTFPLCKSFAEAWQQVDALKRGEHEFKTLAIDSADWLERLVFRQVCADAGKESISDIGGGFGKGQDKAAELMNLFLDQLSEVNESRNLMVIVLAHAKVERYENPAIGAYDRYTPKLDKRINGVIQEWADEVLFANYKVYVKSDGKHFGEEKKLGIGGTERVIYTTEKPSHMAKNHLGLPEELPLAFSSYWDAVKVAKAAV